MDYTNLHVAIIGAGKWGFNHVRTAVNLLPPENITVCDANPDTEKKIKDLNSDIRFTTSLDEILSNNAINAAIIATPAEKHFEVAKKILLAGKHALVEKPITLISSHSEELVNIAEEKNLKLMVGHVLLFHPAVITIKKMIEDGKIGKLQYIYSNRLNLGTIRSEENILWSFAPHDISLCQYFTESYPEVVEAHGADFIQNGIEDTTLTYMRYPGNIHSHIYVSWLHPFKEHRLVIIGDKGMFVFEDSLKTDKLKFYDKGFKIQNGKPEKFDADHEVVDYPNKMPLTEEQIHFYDAVLNNTTPLTDGKHATQVLKILEIAQERLSNGR